MINLERDLGLGMLTYAMWFDTFNMFQLYVQLVALLEGYIEHKLVCTGREAECLMLNKVSGHSRARWIAHTQSAGTRRSLARLTPSPQPVCRAHVRRAASCCREGAWPPFVWQGRAAAARIAAHRRFGRSIAWASRTQSSLWRSSLTVVCGEAVRD
jgi:hypothetical protein